MEGTMSIFLQDIQVADGTHTHIKAEKINVNINYIHFMNLQLVYIHFLSYHNKYIYCTPIVDINLSP